MFESPLCTNVPLPATTPNAERRGAVTWRELVLSPIFYAPPLFTGARFDWAQRIDMREAGQSEEAAPRLTGMTGLSDMAQFDEHGKAATTPLWPFALVCQPSPIWAQRVEAALQAGEGALGALVASLAASDEPIYRLYIVDALDPSALRFAGVLRVSSGASRSTFGDSRLMFRHSLLAEGARQLGPGGERARRWLQEATAGVQRRWEYEGIQSYLPYLPPWPGHAVPPPHCPLQTAWQSDPPNAAPWTAAAWSLLRPLLLLLLAPILLALLLVLAAIPLPLGLVFQSHRTLQWLASLPQLLRALRQRPPLPHAPSFLSDPRDNSAMQLLVSRAPTTRGARHACLAPGVQAVWGVEGLRAFYSHTNVSRDPSGWPLPPIGLVSTVWGTARANAPPRGCCPRGATEQLAALQYGIPVLDGLALTARKERFVAAANPSALLGRLQRALSRGFEALSARVNDQQEGGDARLADEAFTLVATLACDAFFGLPVVHEEAAALGRALRANFSTFDAIAYGLRFGAPSAAASAGHDAIFAYMRRAVAAQRDASEEPSARGGPSDSLLAAYLAAEAAPPSNDEALLADLYHLWNGCYAFAAHLPHMAFALHHLPEQRTALAAEAKALASANASLSTDALRSTAPASVAFAREVIRYFNGVQIVLGSAKRDIPSSELTAEGGVAAEGVAIHSGDFVVACLYATNRMPEHHPSPDTFWPGRWTSETGTGTDAGDVAGFAPFGVGPSTATHRCGGEAVAVAVLPLMAAQLAASWCWQLSLPNERPTSTPLFAHFPSGMPVRPLRTHAQPSATCAAIRLSSSFGLPHSDLYTRLLLQLWRVLRLARSRPRGHEIGDARRLPKGALRTRGPRTDWRGAPAVELPVFAVDEYPEPLYMLAPRIAECFNSAMHRLPMVDDFTPFAPGEDGAAYVHRWLGDVLPPSHETWADTCSDEALTRLCLHGLGAHRVERVTSGGEAAFCVRTNALAPMRVREGYAHYGGDAYFDTNWRVLCIVRAEVEDGRWVRDRAHTPDDPGWEYAKFAFRGSLLTLVTVVDHLHEIHLVWAAAVVRAMREELDADHPIRRLLTPFTFGTIGVNDRIHDHLIAPASLGDRVFAFSEEGFEAVWRAAPSLVRGAALAPPHGSARERALFALDRERVLEAIQQQAGATPHASQCLVLVRTYKRFVRGYLLSAYDGDVAAVAADGELRRFLEVVLPSLAGVMPEGVDASAAVGTDAASFFEFLCCLLASLCERVTAGHEQVGMLAPYVRDPNFCAWRFSPGETSASRRSALSQGVLASMTNMPMPPLMGPPGTLDDWSGALAPSAGGPVPPAVLALYATLQSELAAMARSCDEYNDAASSRPFPLCWPLLTCHPALLELSVSF